MEKDDSGERRITRKRAMTISGTAASSKRPRMDTEREISTFFDPQTSNLIDSLGKRSFLLEVSDTSASHKKKKGDLQKSLDVVGRILSYEDFQENNCLFKVYTGDRVVEYFTNAFSSEHRDALRDSEGQLYISYENGKSDVQETKGYLYDTKNDGKSVDIECEPLGWKGILGEKDQGDKFLLALNEGKPEKINAFQGCGNILSFRESRHASFFTIEDKGLEICYVTNALNSTQIATMKKAAKDGGQIYFSYRHGVMDTVEPARFTTYDYAHPSGRRDTHQLLPPSVADTFQTGAVALAVGKNAGKMIEYQFRNAYENVGTPVSVVEDPHQKISHLSLLVRENDAEKYAHEGDAHEGDAHGGDAHERIVTNALSKSQVGLIRTAFDERSKGEPGGLVHIQWKSGERPHVALYSGGGGRTVSASYSQGENGDDISQHQEKMIRYSSSEKEGKIVDPPCCFNPEKMSWLNSGEVKYFCKINRKKFEPEFIPEDCHYRMTGSVMSVTVEPQYQSRGQENEGSARKPQVRRIFYEQNSGRGTELFYTNAFSDHDISSLIKAAQTETCKEKNCRVSWSGSEVGQINLTTPEEIEHGMSHFR